MAKPRKLFSANDFTCISIYKQGTSKQNKNVWNVYEVSQSVKITYKNLGFKTPTYNTYLNKFLTHAKITMLPFDIPGKICLSHAQ